MSFTFWSLSLYKMVIILLFPMVSIFSSVESLLVNHSILDVEVLAVYIKAIV